MVDVAVLVVDTVGPGVGSGIVVVDTVGPGVGSGIVVVDIVFGVIDALVVEVVSVDVVGGSIVGCGVGETDVTALCNTKNI